MAENKRNSKRSWKDPDDAPEWSDEVWERAEVSVGGRVVRPATGTLTRRGRPPVGDQPKQQVTLRLPPHVLDHFRAGGAGWQTRIGEVLERHVSKTGDASSRVSEGKNSYTAGRREQKRRGD